jgi:hypothetical protein
VSRGPAREACWGVGDGIGAWECGRARVTSTPTGGVVVSGGFGLFSSRLSRGPHQVPSVVTVGRLGCLDMCSRNLVRMVRSVHDHRGSITSPAAPAGWEPRRSASSPVIVSELSRRHGFVVAQAADLAVAQAVVEEGEQSAGHRDAGLLVPRRSAMRWKSRASQPPPW